MAATQTQPKPIIGTSLVDVPKSFLDNAPHRLCSRDVLMLLEDVSLCQKSDWQRNADAEPAHARRMTNAITPNGALLVAVSIVAAIRLRGREIAPSPKLNAVVHDSILLARTILAQLER